MNYQSLSIEELEKNISAIHDYVRELHDMLIHDNPGADEYHGIMADLKEMQYELMEIEQIIKEKRHENNERARKSQN